MLGLMQQIHILKWASNLNKYWKLKLINLQSHKNGHLGQMIRLIRLLLYRVEEMAHIWGLPAWFLIRIFHCLVLILILVDLWEFFAANFSIKKDHLKSRLIRYSNKSKKNNINGYTGRGWIAKLLHYNWQMMIYKI